MLAAYVTASSLVFAALVVPLAVERALFVDKLVCVSCMLPVNSTGNMNWSGAETAFVEGYQGFFEVVLPSSAGLASIMARLTDCIILFQHFQQKGDPLKAQACHRTLSGAGIQSTNAITPCRPSVQRDDHVHLVHVLTSSEVCAVAPLCCFVGRSRTDQRCIHTML